jgi:hypothetical protein
MKKLVALLGALTLMLTMAACGADTQTESEAVTATMTPVEQSVEEVIEASASDAEQAELPPASDSDAVLESSDYTTALEYVGRSVEELYAAIGEPTGGTQYAASCAEENAEDGMLFYDGFYVWSLRTEDQELVYNVYVMD